LAQGFPYSALQALNLNDEYHLAVFNREEPVGQSITNRLHCERREQEGSTPITIVVDKGHAFACSYNTGEDFNFKDCQCENHKKLRKLRPMLVEEAYNMA